MSAQFDSDESVMVTMLQHAADWNKMQTNLTIDEAVKVSVAGLLPDAYVLTEPVCRLTRGYHHENRGKLKEMLLEIVKTGHDVVDDCEERIYRCVKNIEDEGEDPVMIAYAKDDLNHRGYGLISTLGLGKDGVLSSTSYGGVSAFNRLLQKNNLI